MLVRILTSILLLAGVSTAQAQSVWSGNDTGGIIVWSPENEVVALAVAQGHCGWYGKYARITSVYRQHGHFIGFACAFPRGYIIEDRAVTLRVRG